MTKDRNEKARHEMMQKMMMNRMGPWGMPGMGGEMPPQKELTPEEKEEMERQQKEAEKTRRRERITNLNQTIKQKDASVNVMEKSIARMSAAKDLLENVDLKEAKTEWHKKAVKAEIEEVAAVIDEQKIVLEMEKQSRDSMKKELQELTDAEVKEKAGL